MIALLFCDNRKNQKVITPVNNIAMNSVYWKFFYNSKKDFIYERVIEQATKITKYQIYIISKRI